MPAAVEGKRYDATVVGSGPNGLAAAITLAQAGRSVRILEAAPTLGGGMRCAELTLPGFVHDVCSAIHPLGVASPFFRSLPLPAHGLQWIHPPFPLAHPFDDGGAAVLERSIGGTAATLGEDARAYTRALGPLVENAEALVGDLLRPLWPPPRNPLRLARFGLKGMRSARAVAEGLFEGARARGLFAGLAAHAVLPLETAFTASFGYLFGLLGHAYGWPFPRGGAASLADALAKELQTLGADVEVGRRVGSLEELQDSRIVLFDLTPRQILAICGDGLGGSYRRQLERFRYGPGAFKLDFALARPIPWRARECAQAATVHLGASLSEIAASEASLCGGARARPFVIVTQPSLFDETRAPAGRQTAWAYCHVPPGSEEDATGAIEDQIERFAPGFRDTVLARSVLTPSGLATYNENYVGGDIGGGSLAFPQLFLRPSSRLSPYTTPNPRLFIGSASTPPGGGVHGMCGHLAAKAALATTLR